MLILTRKSGQSTVWIMDGKAIGIVTVLRVERDRVSLGFTADPATIKILREELMCSGVDERLSNAID